MKAYWEAQREVDPTAAPEWFSLVVELKMEGKAVGQVGIGVLQSGNHLQGTIGWLLGTRYQRQGLATEAARALTTAAFDQLRLHRISARTALDNQRSWLLMERLSMRREAHFRKSHRVKGEWRDEVVYAVLADEWAARGGS